VLAVAFEPFGPNQPTAQRGGRLLVLAGEIVFPDRPPDPVERVERLALGMQRLALTTREPPRFQDHLDLVLLVLFGDRWEAQNLPLLLAEDVTDEVVFMKPLLDDDNGAMPLVVEPAVESVVVPLIAALRLR